MPLNFGKFYGVALFPVEFYLGIFANRVFLVEIEGNLGIGAGYSCSSLRQCRIFLCLVVILRLPLDLVLPRVGVFFLPSLCGSDLALPYVFCIVSFHSHRCMLGTLFPTSTPCEFWFVVACVWCAGRRAKSLIEFVH